MLTEDSDPGARFHNHSTWTELLRRMCRIVDPSCQTQPGKLDVLQPELGVRVLMAGNGWRETKLHTRQVQFWRTLVDELLGERIILFHVDGDTSWSGRATSLNVRQVQEIALPRLRMALEDSDNVPRERIPELMSRFIPLHPFRAVEAWLFQNTAVLRRLCRDLGQPELLARIDTWEADRTLLDEIDGTDEPKRQMPFKNRHNIELAASAFPSGAVFAAEKSFHDAVVALAGCPALCDGLRRTYASEQFQR